MLGFIKIFLQKSSPGAPLVCDRNQVEAIQRSAEQMNHLIGDLLDTASIEASHLLVKRESCAVAPLVAEAIESMEFMTGGKAIQFKSDCAEGLPPVLVDRHRILQVFSNLIGNAIKFTPAGGTIAVRAGQILEHEVEFVVSDTGKGISAEELPHIFDRFWQVGKTAHLGTGLGLFIAKGIVESHGGHMWARSEPDFGARFHFTLPVDAGQPGSFA